MKKVKRRWRRKRSAEIEKVDRSWTIRHKIPMDVDPSPKYVLLVATRSSPTRFPRVEEREGEAFVV